MAMASGRWLVKRSLGLLTVEQKARVMDASSTGNIWHLPCLAVGAAITMWMLPGRIPFSYVFGILAVFLLTLVLVSVGQAATSIIRLSRAGLPQQYVRGAALRAILFFAALFLLIAAFIIYGLSDYGRQLEHRTQSSNQAMQRTASKAATDVLRVCHPRFGPVARLTGLTVADLVSR
jgi:hypothetical protein